MLRPTGPTTFASEGSRPAELVHGSDATATCLIRPPRNSRLVLVRRPAPLSSVLDACPHRDRPGGGRRQWRSGKPVGHPARQSLRAVGLSSRAVGPSTVADSRCGCGTSLLHCWPWGRRGVVEPWVQAVAECWESWARRSPGPPIRSVGRLRLVDLGCGLGGCCVPRLYSTGLKGRGCCVLVCRCSRWLRPVGPSIEAEGTEEEAEAHDGGESRHSRRFQVSVHRAHDDRAPDARADVRPASKSRRRNRLPEPRRDPSDADGGNARNERHEPVQGQHGPTDDIHSESPMRQVCGSTAAKRDLCMAVLPPVTGPGSGSVCTRTDGSCRCLRYGPIKHLAAERRPHLRCEDRFRSDVTSTYTMASVAAGLPAPHLWSGA